VQEDSVQPQVGRAAAKEADGRTDRDRLPVLLLAGSDVETSRQDGPISRRPVMNATVKPGSVQVR